MSDNRLFFGRQAELTQWEQALADPSGQVVLVVGQQGMGKTMLLDKMAELVGHHPRWKGAAVRYEVTGTDHPDGTMIDMLNHSFEAANIEPGSFESTPQRVRQWKALFAVLPKGKELTELVASLRCDPQQHIREQFLWRLERISKLMTDDGRAVFLIDPEKYMPEGSADTWRLVARDLPPKIKLVFAQRSDGRLMQSEDFLALSNLVRIPQQELDVLDKEAAEQLLEHFGPEIASRGHRTETVRQSIDGYNRHPYAVPAALALLAGGAAIEGLPSDPTAEKIAAAQWRQVRKRDSSAVRLFWAYGVLQVAVPDEVALAVAEIDSAEFQSLLADNYLAGLLRLEGEGRRIYHSLLAKHVAAEVPDEEARALHGRAVKVYRKRLTADEKPDALAVVRLPEHVLAAEGNEAFLNCLDSECTSALLTLGLLDTTEDLLMRALQMAAPDTSAEAALSGNLGLIYETRGDLDRAEEMYRKSLEIDEQIGWQEGMASGYGNLGLIYKTRGDLDRAEEMLSKALKIDERLGRQEGMANAYGNLGGIYRIRGDLDRAEEMLRKSLEIDERLGRQKGMASGYGNFGLIYQTRGELDRAEEMFRKSLEIHERLGRQEGMADQYGNLGLIYETRGELDRAEEMHCKSLEINEQLGRLEGVATAYGNLGLIYQTRGDLDRAEEMHRKALEIDERLGRQEGMASNYGNLGLICQTRGDLDRAEELHRKTLEINQRLGWQEGMANVYANLGAIAEQRSDVNQARTLWQQALELFERIGAADKVELVRGWLAGLPERPTKL